MKLSPKAQEVLNALRANHDGCFDGHNRWASVYLDNARPDGMSPRSFAGYLAALKKAGLYRAQDNFAFGDVLMA